MNPETLARLKEILLTAVRLAADEREAYLDRACGGDAELRREAASLLLYDDRPLGPLAGGELEAMLQDVARNAESIAGPVPLPETIGPYRILSVLGEGGMGIVYLAEQLEPIRREVALKLVHHGYDSEAVRARLAAERQTLARLDHPNVATVLDAGADDQGRPFFVMELVRGLPLGEYCALRGLDARARVALFRDICSAVRHAHRRGVIHRDLKPSNVLVTDVQGAPVPKIIDFGIAKMFEEPLLGTEFRTRTGQLVGTLEYMSPEQARGEAGSIDVRSDVYALGAMFYELLAGRLPVETGDLPLHEVVRRIDEQSPRPLRGSQTTATGRIDADLETIIFKCLEKSADRRYESAAELTEDLDRYLGSRPILARRSSTWYQLRKLAGRHRTATASAALILLILVAFAATVTVQLGIQRRERARAEAAAEEARVAARRAERTSAFLEEMLASAAPSARGQDLTVREVLDETAGRIEDDLAAEPEVLADSLLTLGKTYGALGDVDRGLEHLRHSLELYRSNGADDADVARALQAIGERLFEKGDYDGAHESLNAALETENRPPTDPHPRTTMILAALAQAELMRGNLEEAERLAADAVSIAEQVPGKDGEELLVETLTGLAYVLDTRQQFEQGLPVARRAHELSSEIHGPDAPQSLTALVILGSIVGQSGRDPDEAEALYREVLERSRRVYPANHFKVAAAANNLAALLLGRGRPHAARPLQEEALAIWREVFGEHPFVVTGLNLLAFMRHSLGEYDEAAALYREALALAERLGPHPVGPIQRNLGLLLVRSRPEEAEALLRRFLAEVMETGTDSLPSAWRRAALAGVLAEVGKCGEATSLLDEAEQILGRSEVAGDTRLVAIDVARALCLDAAGDRVQARNHLDEAKPVLVEGVDRPVLRRLLLEASERLYASWGDSNEAAACGKALVKLAESLRGSSPEDD